MSWFLSYLAAGRQDLLSYKDAAVLADSNACRELPQGRREPSLPRHQVAHEGPRKSLVPEPLV